MFSRGERAVNYAAESIYGIAVVSNGTRVIFKRKFIPG
jgi:hypothetical protein